jgi:Knl1 RWD C-terminal domain
MPRLRSRQPRDRWKYRKLVRAPRCLDFEVRRFSLSLLSSMLTWYLVLCADELNNLQDLHLWRAIQLSTEMVEFVYDSKYRVTIPCRRYSPIPEALNVVPFGDQSQANDDFPLVTELMYRIARRKAIQNHDNKLTLRMVRRIINCTSFQGSNCIRLFNAWRISGLHMHSCAGS